MQHADGTRPGSKATSSVTARAVGEIAELPVQDQDQVIATVGVVILHYRGWPMIDDCLQSVMAQTRPVNQLVVVDNASSDGSPERLKNSWPTVNVLHLEANMGYSAAINAGILALLETETVNARPSVDALLVLTHDCILAPEAVQTLSDALETHSNLGAVGPLLGYRHDPRTVLSAGGGLSRKGWDAFHHHGADMMSDITQDCVEHVDWIDGACVLLRSLALGDTGLFDERYFLYYEDVEYGVRMARAGWSVANVPSACAWQRPGVVPPYLYARNVLLFLAEHAGIRLFARQIIRELGWICGVPRKSAPRSVVARLQHLLGLLAALSLLTTASGRTPRVRLGRVRNALRQSLCGEANSPC